MLKLNGKMKGQDTRITICGRQWLFSSVENSEPNIIYHHNSTFEKQLKVEITQVLKTFFYFR